MISFLAWIPKGAAKSEPEYADFVVDDIDALMAAAYVEAQPPSGDEVDTDSEPGCGSDSGSDLDDDAALEKAKAMASAAKRSTRSSQGAPSDDHLAAAMAELDMDRYDDDDSDVPLQRILGSGNPGMAYHRDPEDDPYLNAVNSRDDDDGEHETESEIDDLNLRDTDLLILAARNEEDVSHLEVWVYEEPDERGEGNLYVHHAVLLPAFPLSLAWLDCDPSGKKVSGNFAAIGSFEPGIEIWDMDVLDAVEPVATLGGADYEAASTAASQDSKKKKKKKKPSKIPKVPVLPGSHEDAVLGLAWNREYRNVLASASADKTVKIWDISTCEAAHTLTHHSGKVQAVAWNPAEAPVLLSGGFDRKVFMVDVRVPNGSPPSWELSADVEALDWNPHNPTNFAASLENGEVVIFDARRGTGSPFLLRLAAHNKSTTAVAFNPQVDGLLLTGSTDKRVKLWEISTEGSKPPRELACEDLKVGAVFGAAFCRDTPMLVAAGGAKGAVAVWDTTQNDAVAAFAQSKTEV